MRLTDKLSIYEFDLSLTPLDGRLTINGLNLAARGFLNSSAGLGGFLDVDATIASKHDEREIRGTARISKARLVAGSIQGSWGRPR